MKSTLQNFVKNVFYKHALEFQVECFFASVKLFKKNFTKCHTSTVYSQILFHGNQNDGLARSVREYQDAPEVI